jgi:hypothetical protein
VAVASAIGPSYRALAAGSQPSLAVPVQYADFTPGSRRCGDHHPTRLLDAVTVDALLDLADRPGADDGAVLPRTSADVRTEPALTARLPLVSTVAAAFIAALTVCGCHSPPARR